MDNQLVQVIAGAYIGGAIPQALTWAPYGSVVDWPLAAFKTLQETSAAKPILLAAAPVAGAWAAMKFGPASMGPWPLAIAGAAIAMFIGMQGVNKVGDPINKTEKVLWR